LKKNSLLSLCVLLLLLACKAVQAAPLTSVEPEYVIVTGGPSLIEWERFKKTPHDHWWANFIHASRIRLSELRAKEGPHALITWLVYRPSYERRSTHQEKRDLLADIISVQKKYNLHLVFFNSHQQLIHYLNNGQPRDQVKIVDFEYFGHSNRACFMFDYSNQIDTGSKAWLHEKELYEISPIDFAPHAFIKSWGCHTGESMSKCWYRSLKQPMIGAIGPTDYSNSDDSSWHPSLMPHGRWSQ
jgi:hypothetical protein